ncbi:uncharacterized protein LOC128245499 [Mya arenaria]|uniref:uncharacterized protein LOC128245499 n=1 Tax=Mya arenaria TaxID=6604 RepID=UPI0022E908ED|nr:uncharacterized protein LOC128245499 [Mya arenaria]
MLQVAIHKRNMSLLSMGFLLCAIHTIFVRPISTKTVEFQSRYYTNTTLHCDIEGLNLPRVTFKYWILPNGTTLQYWHNNGSKFTVGEWPIYNLTIADVTAEDFGYYYCVIFWDPRLFLASSVKIGLNTDGANFDDLKARYVYHVYIGSVVAGATALAISSLCLLYWCKYSEQNTVNEVKDANLSDENNSESNAHKKDTMLIRRCFKRRQSSNSSVVSGIEEKRAVYELDNVVEAFDDGYSKPGDLSYLRSLGGDSQPPLEVRGIIEELRAEFDNTSGSDITPPLPPPPPMDDDAEHWTEGGVEPPAVRDGNDETDTRPDGSVYDVPRNSSILLHDQTIGSIGADGSMGSCDQNESTDRDSLDVTQPVIVLKAEVDDADLNRPLDGFEIDEDSLMDAIKSASLQFYLEEDADRDLDLKKVRRDEAVECRPTLDYGDSVERDKNNDDTMRASFKTHYAGIHF